MVPSHSSDKPDYNRKITPRPPFTGIEKALAPRDFQSNGAGAFGFHAADRTDSSGKAAVTAVPALCLRRQRCQQERRYGTAVTKTYARYQCSYNIQHPGGCDGPSGCGEVKLDDLVDQIIRYSSNVLKRPRPTR